MSTAGQRARRMLTFSGLEVASFAHSVVYLLLLLVAVLVHVGGIGGLKGVLFVLGMAHGIGWIVMSIAALIALRIGVITLRLAAAVAVVGAVGPFVGSFEFVRESRRRAARASVAQRALSSA